MASSVYESWFERGREHQREGRLIDAMLCFRRAQREKPGSDAPFHLGEALWQLNRWPEAIAAWREAAAIDSRHLAPRIALAEALLAIGDPAAALDAAAAVQLIEPQNGRAALIHAIAGMALGRSQDEMHALEAALARDGRFLVTPTIAGPLALALDRIPEAAGTARLLATLLGRDPALTGVPPLLLAIALEHALRSGVDGATLAPTIASAVSRDYAPPDHDALRRIALCVSEVDRGASASLGARYAALCAGVFSPAVGQMWPRRTAGARLRAIVLLPGTSLDPAAQEVLDALAMLAASPSGDAFAIDIATIGVADPSTRAAASNAARASVVELPAMPDTTVAQSLAARDPDVLIDLAGLAAATGPIAGARPARYIVGVAMPRANVAPLIDRVFDGAGDLVDALRGLAGQHVARDDCALDAQALASLWEEGVRAHQQADSAAARAAYTRLIELQPGYAPAHYLRGVLERDARDAEAARQDFAAALAAAPHYVDARLAAVRAAMEANEPRVAAALSAEGLAHDPGEVGLWRALGHAQLRLQEGAAAAGAFERALAIDPNDAETHYNQGVALQMSGALGRAARAYQRALAIAPGMLAADFNLGVLFQDKGETAAAIAAYQTVLKSNPRYTAAYKNLGEVLSAARKIDAWIENFERFEAHCPEALPLAVQGLESWQYMADYARLERYLGGLSREAYRADDELQLADCIEELLYLLLFFDVDGEMPFRFAQTYDASAKRVYGEPLPRPAARKPGRLRIGYLSADLRNHVMGKMMWQAVSHHDRERFELYFYSLSSASDEWTERYRGLAHAFVDVSASTERHAALRIAEDDVDILIDLSTHTKGAKPGILALKPARVQVTHVASSGSTGLSAVDFKLTDRYADVPESQEFMQERLLAMEGCVYPYRHVAPAAAHPFKREVLGIPRDAIVLGAFVTALKLSRRCLRLWREVLERVPRAKLAFSPTHAAARASYVRLAAAAGIAADRLIFVPQGRDDAENQARYELVDFVLDTMPYGGVNGTLEALDMGVPVVTLMGKRHGERTSYTILANLGVVDTVAQSGPDYVAIAVRLADDPAFMSGVRASIRRGLEGSALTDMAAHTRHLEAAYLAALRQCSPGIFDSLETRDG